MIFYYLFCVITHSTISQRITQGIVAMVSISGGGYHLCLEETSHIDFVNEKRHMDVGGLGVGACDVSR